MRDKMLQVDPDTRDLVFVDGDFALTSGADATAQAVRVTLQVYLGEWFTDTTHGTDYQRIMGQDPTEAQIDEIVRAAVYQETNVQHIDELTISRQGRQVTVALKARLKSGEGIAVEVDV